MKLLFLYWVIHQEVLCKPLLKINLLMFSEKKAKDISLWCRTKGRSWICSNSYADLNSLVQTQNWQECYHSTRKCRCSNTNRTNSNRTLSYAVGQLSQEHHQIHNRMAKKEKIKKEWPSQSPGVNPTEMWWCFLSSPNICTAVRTKLHFFAHISWKQRVLGLLLFVEDFVIDDSISLFMERYKLISKISSVKCTLNMPTL